MFRDGLDTLAHALAEAEVACRGAKDRGCNRVEQYDTNDESLMRRQGDVIAAGLLREALNADDFLLHAQPIVSLADTSVVCGYELLLRMRGRDGNTVNAAEIISAAHRYQLMPSIDRWVVQHATQKLAPHRDALLRRGMCMSINISGQSIGDPEFLSFLAQQLSRSGLAPSSVMIEITEQTAIATRGDAADRLRELCGRGWRLALDDFGTGTNSFSNLKELPIARIKIDGSFVRDLLTSRRSAATVRLIAQLAKGEGIDTVAEYVEMPAVAQKLRMLCSTTAKDTLSVSPSRSTRCSQVYGRPSNTGRSDRCVIAYPRTKSWWSRVTSRTQGLLSNCCAARATMHRRRTAPKRPSRR